MSDIWRGTGGELLFRDPATGITWRVHERDCPPDLPAPPFAAAGEGRQHRCLVFESETAVRRVWSYPATWRMLSRDELIALSWSR